jgi:hypothetical protein
VLFLFCSAYYVADIDVFLIPIYALGALLLVQGLAAGADLLPDRRAHVLTPLALALPLLLLVSNWGTLRMINTNADEMFARSIMAHHFPEHALIIGDWSRIESLRYLQTVEGQHPTVDMLISFDTADMMPRVREALFSDQPIYGLGPLPGLGLQQIVEGPVWRIENKPLEITPTTPAHIRWAVGIELARYSVLEGPYQPGESVPIAIAWQAWALPAHSYSMFIHIIDATGQIWGQHDGAPSVSTETWQAGAEYKDLYALLLSPETPPGRYQVQLGWYHYPALEHLALAQPAAANPDYAILGEIEVRAATSP